MFSQRIESVSDTNINARVSAGYQTLVYEMRLKSKTAVAMVLPLPTASEPSDNALSFIDLSKYPEFFDDMVKCFPEPPSRSAYPVAAAAGNILRVHRVGSFDASFVPGIVDFVRLDPRFRLPDDVWASAPLYHDYSFAVFQLAAGDMRVHPMAMKFETRDSGAIYFPTTHVHDGAIHAVAEFDHALYAQLAVETLGWTFSSVRPHEVMDFGGA